MWNTPGQRPTFSLTVLTVSTLTYAPPVDFLEASDGISDVNSAQFD